MNDNKATPNVQNSLAPDAISVGASKMEEKKAKQRKYRKISVLLIGIIVSA